MCIYAVAKDTPDSDNDTTCAELKADEGYKSSVNNGTISRSCSRPMSICSEPEKKWMDVVAGKSFSIDFRAKDLRIILLYLSF